MGMGWWLVEELLQAKADEEPLRCGDWSEEGCGGNSFQRAPEWEGRLSRCFFDTRIPRRLWWGAGLGSPVFRFGLQLSSFPSSMSLFQFGLYMSQTSLMLTPTMESWQDRELDAKTSYLMDNVKYTSRGTFCLFDWSPPLLHFFLRSWGLLAYFPASFGHLLHYKNSAHCKANSNLITCLCWLGMMLDETNWWRMTIPKYILYRWENWFWGKEGRCSQFKPMGWLTRHLILGIWSNF